MESYLTVQADGQFELEIKSPVLFVKSLGLAMKPLPKTSSTKFVKHIRKLIIIVSPINWDNLLIFKSKAMMVNLAALQVCQFLKSCVKCNL